VGSERPRQARDRGLGGVVLQIAAACDDGTYGGDVNDGAALVAAHQRNRRLGTEDVAHQVDAEDLVPARRARLVDLLVFADAGVVDKDVEAPELVRGAVDEIEACGLGTDVSVREGDLGAGGLELGRHAPAALAVPIAECHTRPPAGWRACKTCTAVGGRTDRRSGRRKNSHRAADTPA